MGETCVTDGTQNCALQKWQDSRGKFGGKNVTVDPRKRALPLDIDAA